MKRMVVIQHGIDSGDQTCDGCFKLQLSVQAREWAGCMLFGRQWPLTPEALKKGESAFITGHDVPRLPECMAAETPYERQHPPEVDHVVRAWKLLESLSRIDAGFLQRLLLIALQTPPLSLNTALPEALILVPAILKGQPTNPSDEALQLAHQLADLARQDPKFLDHYLAGLPRADFL